MPTLTLCAAGFNHVSLPPNRILIPGVLLLLSILVLRRALLDNEAPLLETQTSASSHPACVWRTLSLDISNAYHQLVLSALGSSAAAKHTARTEPEQTKAKKKGALFPPSLVRKPHSLHTYTHTCRISSPVRRALGRRRLFRGEDLQLLEVGEKERELDGSNRALLVRLPPLPPSLPQQPSPPKREGESQIMETGHRNSFFPVRFTCLAFGF